MANAVEKDALDKSASSRDSTNSREDLLTKRRKEMFGDCALIEIIHLHDCLRGALKALHADVNALARVLALNETSGSDETAAAPAATPAVLADLERRVAGRFKVIWSVFKSHSQAEDEFIWPALKEKTQGRISGSPKHAAEEDISVVDHSKTDTNHKEKVDGSPEKSVADDDIVEQEEYEEDHADEERMFSEMDTLLTSLREVLQRHNNSNDQKAHQGEDTKGAEKSPKGFNDIGKALSTHTSALSLHLMTHLEKEETQCMPLVIKFLSKSEIHDLVGNIMGKRSADTIAQIMTMAVQNLDKEDREEMVKYMKQSMAGTFFDRWLTMSGWNGSTDEGPDVKPKGVARRGSATRLDDDENEDKKRPANPPDESNGDINKRIRVHVDEDDQDIVSFVTEPSAVAAASSKTGSNITSPTELETLIRAIASNASLTPEQKNTTIQGLRDSIWKSNQRQREQNMNPPTVVNVSVSSGPNFPIQSSTTSGSASLANSRTRRVTPPSMYFKKSKNGKTELIWACDSNQSARDQSVPLFSASELAPTYHDGAAGTVLGCPHYARACKLRHPTSDRLYTCRLCCQQEREMPMKDRDEPLDRYSVSEVYCMKCNTLQPAEDRCINNECESRGKPFAKYFCRICHLYDDGSRPIFHCPYCNTCRLGQGLGIDFRHCMRCNACVALSDTEHHCIPQKLQGSCPICHESLFQSTDPLRGLKCGHVMHLSCFTEYKRGHSYTCPLCMRSMEDMSDYFARLDTAVRMQPMPAAYLSTMSNIYCQDCGETGQTQYHFVGQKCPKCNSYNTREMGRVHNSPSASPIP